MTSIVTFPWRAVHEAMGVEKISVGRFALASAPVIGVAVSVAFIYLKLRERASKVEEANNPPILDFPDETPDAERAHQLSDRAAVIKGQWNRIIEIFSEASDYAKAGIISGLSTLVIIALGVSLVGLTGGSLAAGYAGLTVSFLLLKRMSIDDSRKAYGHRFSECTDRSTTIARMARQMARAPQDNAAVAAAGVGGGEFGGSDPEVRD